MAVSARSGLIIATVIIVLVAGLSLRLGTFGLFSSVIGKTCYQVSEDPVATDKVSPIRWGILNHTLFIAKRDKIESLLRVNVIRDPPFPRITVELFFEPVDNLVPRVAEGPSSWNGTLKAGDVLVLRTILVLDRDGRYFLGSRALSISESAIHGLTAVYYVYVQNGSIQRISDNMGDISSACVYSPRADLCLLSSSLGSSREGHAVEGLGPALPSPVEDVSSWRLGYLISSSSVDRQG